MAPPDTPRRRGRKRSKRRTASTSTSAGPRQASLSQDARPRTLPPSPSNAPAKNTKKGRNTQTNDAHASTNTPTTSATGNTNTTTTANIQSKKAVKVTTIANNTTDSTAAPNMSQNDTLDSLCNLLEKIMAEHKGPPAAAASSNRQTPKAKGGGGGGGVTQKSQPGVGSPGHDASTSTPSTSTNAEGEEEKSREEVEKERKARKEAKKAKKKGGGGGEGTTGGSDDKERKKEQQQPQPQPSTSAGQDNTAAPSSSAAAAGAPAGKSKADLRRERREKQEAQRLAKVAQKQQQEEEEKKKQDKKVVIEKQKTTSRGVAGGSVRRGRFRRASGKGGGGERKVPLFGHLPQYSSSPPPHQINSEGIHPSVMSVGLKMKFGVLEGATARVVSTLAALKRFVSDYHTPEACDLSRDMAEKLKPNVDFLHACRPHAIAMDNAVRSIKHKINSVDPGTPEAQAKDELRDALDQFVQENVVLAASTIATHAAKLLKEGDVLLTFGYSGLVYDVVEAMVRRGECGGVSVVVADYPHPPSGAAMVQRLTRLGVPTYYRLVTDLTHVMSKVTKVMVEAEAVMMNGAVQGPCGTASLALAAATHHKPFIVLCQTYKFCNLDLTDSLVVNELGDPNIMVCNANDKQQGSNSSSNGVGVLSDWRDTPNLNVVRLVYDVTPASLVTVLVTEQSVLPTSAVPVIIHRKYADILGQD